MRTRVYARTRFEGFHHWPDAPEPVAFLRTLHRHEFHVRVDVEVTDHDREVEFILLKRMVDDLLRQAREASVATTHRWSCEHWATHIGTELQKAGVPVVRVEVNEDGENGSIIECDRFELASAARYREVVVQ